MASTHLTSVDPFQTFKAFTSPPRRISLPAITVEPLHPERSTQSKSPIQPERRSRFQEQFNPSAKSQTLDQKFNPLYTCLLFTFSDLKNILVPQTLLGVVTALTCSEPSIPGAPLPPALQSAIFYRLPLAAFWVWIHLLLFNTSNQTQPGALAEDAQNKPWRPLPANRISHASARRLFYATSILCIAFSYVAGGLVESIVLQALTFLYDDLALGDEWFVARSVINSMGYTNFSLGAIQVLLRGQDTSIVLSNKGCMWLALLTFTIFTTGHIMDLEDLEGDRVSGRRTIPVLVGEEGARWSILLPMMVGLISVLRFWECRGAYPIVVFALGATVVRRLAKGNDEREGYRKTFKLWTCWVMAVYLLPLFAQRWE